MILIRHFGTKAFINALSLILLSLPLGSAQLAWSADVQPGEEGPSTFKAMGVVIPPQRLIAVLMRVKGHSIA